MALEIEKFFNSEEEKKVNQITALYQEGHKAGYDVGHTKGYQAGFRAGYREGHSKGYTSGYAKALERLGQEVTNAKD